MKVLLLSGSSNHNSRSIHLARAIEAELKANVCDVTLIDLIDYGLPFFDVMTEKNKTYDAKTKEFIDMSYAADAHVWVTPIYHNSFSGLLKNALDWQRTFLTDKVVGMASNGGDRTTVAVDHLLLIARSQRMIASTVRVCTTESDYDSELNIIAEDIQVRIKNFSTELVRLTNKIRS